MIRSPSRREFAAIALAAAPLPARAAAPGPMRLLILGGTGFIGPHQVRYALSRGHKVTVFNRGRRPQDWPGEVEELTGDRNSGDLAALEGRSWDACIDNPTTLPFWVRDAAEILGGKVAHYLFVSTMSVYADNATPGQDEAAPRLTYPDGDPLAARDASAPMAYGRLKAASEAEARRGFGAGKVAVVRPGLIVGPGDETDRFTYWPARLAGAGQAWGPRVLAPGDGTDPVMLIDARDLAEWTVRLAEARTAGVFNAAGPDRPLSMKAFLAGVAEGVGARPDLAWAPAGWLAERKVAYWSDMPVWLPGEGPTAGFHRRSLRAALGAGLTFRPLPVTARDTLAWFRTLPAERQARLKAGLTPQREAELLADLSPPTQG
ncbi:NAD-dependent epimerase/dehydratase family protein [Phenylobacterium sp.]|uniref:NAD-dependent epimerase/dehydratase family protein n=1 Tax=Phenylobacterium sp. TaxID=1871053 RepID=UPI00301B9A07